ncbi:MAG: ARMT1-like domain-containing protein [Candidatus Thermoplasmatota archaeon]|jgi:uncharacterized protein with ATP-grasp and redox domains|nr:ARMT1-like domain-containing protein [Candidatus Thermoplasmatota archaeon]
MKIQTECVPCLLKRVIFETEQSTKNPNVRKKVIKNACKILSELYDPDECSAVIATEVHRVVYEVLGDKDPYKNLKDLSNKVAQSLVPRVEELIKKSDDPLRTSILCSIIGNTLDFGIEGGSSHPDVLKDLFEKYVSDGLGYDDTPKVKVLLKKAKNVVLFTDNCGEIVFDKILCRELKKFNQNMFLTLVVRGEPIISDATTKDAEELRFNEVVDEVLTTGCFAIGVDFRKIPGKLKKTLKKADLIICKGMANYESFSETDYHPIAYLLRTKCNAIAKSMDLPLNINAVKLYR